MPGPICNWLWINWGLKARANSMFCKVVFDVPLDRDFDYTVPPELEPSVAPGVRVTAPFGRVLTCGLVTAVSEISTAPAHITLKPIAAVLDKTPLFGADLFPLARFIKARWGGPVGQILFALIPPQPYFKLLPLTAPVAGAIKTPSLPLTPSQQRAMQLVQSVPPYQFGSFLFSGNAYTGKTETALLLAEQAFKQHGQVLITVPDIMAARQFINQVENRFGKDNVFSWHSRTLLSQKKQYYSAIANGRPCVVVAARSGVLLPFKNLRLAVMLHEEDDNYKQEENKPYYHARDVLLFRARVHGAAVVYVSDTPSVQMRYQVAQKQITELAFTEPVGPVYQPVITLTPKKGEKSKFFSDQLLAKLAGCRTKKIPALLILNRRGYAGAYACLNCGAYAKCKKCGTILTHEKLEDTTQRLYCKKCGAVEPLEQECPKCRNVIFKSRAGGTQKIVTELKKFFPTASLLRLDSDSLKTKTGQGFTAVEALHNGRADLIVGTRLAAGALRGTRVGLAAILDAELELDGPSFRTSEKYGQLLFELRGHLAQVPGAELLVQTADASAYDYAPVQTGQYDLAAENERYLRESFVYPPYAHLIRVTLKAKEFNLLEQETARLRRAAEGKVLEVLGPVWCAKKTDKLKKQYLLFKTDTPHYLDLLACLDSFVPAKKVTLQISADPYNFY